MFSAEEWALRLLGLETSLLAAIMNTPMTLIPSNPPLFLFPRIFTLPQWLFG